MVFGDWPEATSSVQGYSAKTARFGDPQKFHLEIHEALQRYR